MPTISEVLVYDVPKIGRIEGTPCMIAPCPYCRGVHTFPMDTNENVKAQCPAYDGDFGCGNGRPRPAYHALIHGGPAPRQLLLIFETSKDMKDDLALLEALQPRELWQEIYTFPNDRTDAVTAWAGDLDAQRQMGDALIEGSKKLAPLLNKLLANE